jgi:hypothetical protein
VIFLDTNIVIDLLEPKSDSFAWSRRRVAEAAVARPLVTDLIVAAECAGTFPDVATQLGFFEKLGVTLLRPTPAASFRGGQAHRAYRRAGGPRSAILADFLIGGHAAEVGATLMTRDPQRFAAYFRDLPLITPDTHP